MNRRSDIGWPELSWESVLIILGVLIMCQPVGVTYLDRGTVWCACNLKWNCRYCSVCSKWNALPGLDRSFHLSQEFWSVMAGFMLAAHPRAGTLGACNGTSESGLLRIVFPDFLICSI